jgi:transcriptional regulator with XRE-family HTH domain
VHIALIVVRGSQQGRVSEHRGKMSKGDRGSTALADFVRQRIETKGWSIRQTAVKAGISPLALGNLLRGLVVPRVETLQKLAPALNVEAPELLRLAGYLPKGLVRDSEAAIVQVAERLSQLPPPIKAEAIRFTNGIIDVLEQLPPGASTVVLADSFDQQWETMQRPDDIRAPVKAVPHLDE